MFKFTQHNGIVMPLDIANIDTDIIIPKQFLQKVNKLGFGKYLFHNWRFIDENQSQINPNFILNIEKYKKSSILLTRDNFGCGSSREHAVWALLDYGFKVIIAPSFSDIFYNNSFNNKLLLITLPNNQIDKFFNIINQNPGIYFNIDLLKNEIKVEKKIYSFQIDKFRRFCLLNGLDDIDLTLKNIEKIDSYEKKICNFLIKRKKFVS
uniref:3-isopropylmalate dehydratase small subunit n=1 Tax=Buchnera aphidicola subsp. Pterocomma populeum TaxID=98792 RepID=LEUD_BUCPP|nr:RecName: Full=3-isopropylmalate dehydratase small subunit; AltName: Full=Alpha-IPM isomerase; Short=IPMI; AltName: Full=Isopropylmalate isomerase [Buchnera aphidicola (Pterocomma populeum)]CAA07298.1 3-isopropylmalate dehydratase subunit [Buchnera aphidicola]